jgi:hypothetical protein
MKVLILNWVLRNSNYSFDNSCHESSYGAPKLKLLTLLSKTGWTGQQYFNSYKTNIEARQFDRKFIAHQNKACTTHKNKVGLPESDSKETTKSNWIHNRMSKVVRPDITVERDWRHRKYLQISKESDCPILWLYIAFCVNYCQSCSSL